MKTCKVLPILAVKLTVSRIRRFTQIHWAFQFFPHSTEKICS